MTIFRILRSKWDKKICPEIDQKLCLEKIGFFVFLCFYEVILALENSPEKYNSKDSNSPEINSKLLFSGKMAPENTYEIE